MTFEILLTRLIVCHDHQAKQTIQPYELSSAEIQNMAELANTRALQQRDYELRDLVECHISFVLADDLRCAIREKVIASTKDYPRYMDLVNFLVKLITDRYTMTGLGVMGPLGYAKVNNQVEWDAMLEVIRSTPTMSSIALCTVETELHEVRKGRGATRRVHTPISKRTSEVIEID